MPYQSLHFRYPWRPYQERVLNALDQHLSDRRLHVVAAPGAGKTTLGLEVFRRLGKRALVLSPTRVIRDQWLQRLEDFCGDGDVAALDWVSKDLGKPRVLTSITYQALHARMSDEPAEEEGEETPDQADDMTETEIHSLIKTLQDHCIEVLILDEAHHLRAEWWRALDKVCATLTNLVLVSLTATPPYDAEGHEWIRYEQLCGPIDEEISVPELVKAGTLCAHQDFIWAVNVSPSEQKRIEEYDKRVMALCNSLFRQDEFHALVFSHPWVGENIVRQEVLAEPHVAMALMCFFKACGSPLPVHLSTVLDIAVEDIPELGRKWWQTLIEAVLFSKTFKHTEADLVYVDQLKRQLKSSELLHRQELSLERSRRLERSLTLSSAKVDACVSIHRLEYKHRQESLRQVVLTDYIRDEKLHTGLDTGEVNLGAWPVFKGLIAASKIAHRIALLSGRLSIVHSSLLDRLLELVERDRFSCQAITGFSGYHKVTGPLNQLTVAFTTLLMRGEINTLVGTRSLLGEGWDAPAINSLVLGSAVGTFMLTNQMRGRAIRIDKKAPAKVSTVWHLVAIDTKSDSGLNDYRDLRNRFETFVGLSEKSKTIESGLERLNATGFDLLKFQGFENRAVPSNNRQMIRRYHRRTTLTERWQAALTLDHDARVLPSVYTSTVPGLRTYHVKNTLKHLLYQLTAVLAAAVSYALAISHGGKDLVVFLMVGALGCVGAFLYQLPNTIAVVRILLKHLPIDGALKQIGMALSEALCRAGLIETSFRRLKVRVVQEADGSFCLALAGGTFYESSLFADALAELLAPIDSPRYLVVREGTVYGMKRDDYHAVPLKLAVNKEAVQIFYKAWCKYVGPTELIYTRSDGGREHLLKARMRAFSATFANQVKRQDRWQ